MTTRTDDVVVGITGASGALYARRLLEILLGAGRRVHLTISPAGAEVLKTELDITVDLENFDVSQLDLPAERFERRGDAPLSPLPRLLGPDRQRLISHRRDGDLSLFDGDAGRRGQWPVDQPDSARGRRAPQGAAKVDRRAAGDAARQYRAWRT